MTAHPTAVTEAPAALSYRVGAGGAGGVWLGLGVARVTVLGIALLVGIVALTVGFPITVAILPVLLSALIAGARVAGRPVLDWLTPALTHTTAVGTAGTRWRAGAPTMPRGGSGGGRLRLPGEYGRPRVLNCPDDPSIAMVADPPGRTVTVVFDVCGVDRFPLLDDVERDGLLAGWGEALAVLADTDDALARVQLIERAHPSPALPSRVAGGDGDGDAAGWREEIAALATAHDSRLAVQWVFPRLDAAAFATIAVRAQLMASTLLSARLLARPLAVEEVRDDIVTTLTGQPSRGGGAALSRRADWTQVRLDDRWHRCYAVTGWPTGPVAAGWLSPLLLATPSTATRTVALHLECVAPAAAARVARSRRAKAILDQSDRTRFGMTSSAALEQAEAAGVAMDTELASGYRAHRLSGLVTLSADSSSGLDDAGRVLRQAAAVCRVEIRPLHGQHDLAVAATVPLCRLRTRGSA